MREHRTAEQLETLGKLRKSYEDNRISVIFEKLDNLALEGKSVELISALSELDRDTLILLALNFDVEVGVNEEDTVDFEDTETLRVWLAYWIES